MRFSNQNTAQYWITTCVICVTIHVCLQALKGGWTDELLSQTVFNFVCKHKKCITQLKMNLQTPDSARPRKRIFNASHTIHHRETGVEGWIIFKSTMRKYNRARNRTWDLPITRGMLCHLSYLDKIIWQDSWLSCIFTLLI